MISIRLRGLSKLMVLLRDFRQGLHGLVPLFSGLLGTGRRLILRQPSAIPPGEGNSAWLGCRSGGSTLLRRQRWGRRARRPGRDAGALMLDAIPDAGTMLADKGYDADWFRSALKHSGIVPCIPSRSNRKILIE